MLVTSAVLACSSSDTDSDRNVDVNSGGSASSGGQALSGGSVLPLSGGLLGGSGGASGSGGTLGMPGDAGVCGTGTTMAERSPVNMLVMFDRSGSMVNNGSPKWANATAALSSFFTNPGAAGLRVALRFFPHDAPASGCTDNGCDATACSQPLVALGELTPDAAPQDPHEAALLAAIAASAPGGRTGGGGGTPIYAALDGALRWAAQNRLTFPTEDTVVIFVTDGAPNGCDEDFTNISTLASDALTNSNVKTYAIGLEGSNTQQMDQLALAGGTGMGIYIGNSANAEQDLLNALNAIRSETLSCNVKMPTPADPTVPVDPSKVNVTFTTGDGMQYTVAQAADEPACQGNASWYYDDPQSPIQIILCPATCDIVRNDTEGQLEILLGCPTVCGGLDINCGGEPIPPDVPPLLE